MTQLLPQVLITAIIIMLASLAGVVALWGSAGTFIEQHLSKLVSFSSGVFITVAASLALESYEHIGTAFPWVISIIGGMLILWIISLIIPEAHHHHTTHNCPSDESCPNPRHILFSDGIHNIADGLVLAASFAASSTLGIAAAIGIFVHELIQEISEFFVLKEGGYSTKRALVLNFLVSGTLIIGVGIGFFFLSNLDEIEGIFLGVASGAFLYTVTLDLIPHSVRASRETQSFAPYIAAALLGIITMLLLGVLIGH